MPGKKKRMGENPTEDEGLDAGEQVGGVGSEDGPPTEPDPAADGESLDAEGPTPEAWRSTRAALRAANREAAGRRKEIGELEGRISEMESTIEALTTRAETAEADLRERAQREAVETAARGLGYHDQGARDVFALLDVGALLDEDGQLAEERLQAALEDAAQARPYLLEQGAPAHNTNVQAGGEGDGGDLGLDEQEIAAEFGIGVT